MKEWFQGLVVEDERDERAHLRGPSLIAWLFVVGLVCAGMVTCAGAQEAEVEVDCHDFASFASTMSVYRWVGADLSRVVQMLRRSNTGQDPDRLKVYEDEVRRIWRLQPSQDDAEASAFKRCMDLMGSFPKRREG